MIKQYKKLTQIGEKLKKGNNVIKKPKQKPKKVVISKTPPKPKPKIKTKNGISVIFGPPPETPPKNKPKKVVNFEKPPKHKKLKSFQEYFEECIKNKKIPKDTPPYFRKALERAILEYNKKTKTKTKKGCYF